jgi:hypothetical protein
MVKSDIKSCDRFYYIGADVIKQINRTQDTFTYFHDGELIIFYNQKKTNRLSENTFYIFNHGFNKLITMRILMIEIEASNGKKDKKKIVTAPESYLDVYYKDSLDRCSFMTAGPLQVHVPGYKEAKITALFTEVLYYDQHIYRWFLKEPEVPGELINIQWNKVRGE